MSNIIKILLINPPYFQAPGRFERKALYTEPPLGLAYLASYLRTYSKGVQIEILDAATMKMTHDEICTFTKKKKYDIIGCTVVTATALFVKNLFKNIKEFSSQVLTVAGGPHPTALPFDLMPEGDISVIGEGEKTLCDIVDYSLGIKKLEEIPGIAYIKNGTDIINPVRNFIEDLDSIPYPARDLLPMAKYTHQYPHKTKTKNYSTIITSRGCPYHCTFCGVKKMWGQKVRFRSVEDILGEISQLVDKYNVSFFYFFDDTFIINQERLISICKGITEIDSGIRWACFSRVDLLNEEKLRIIKDAGCVEIQLGVESGDPEILKRIKKGITVEKARKAFNLTHKIGLNTKGFFIIGNDGETRETVQKTINLAIELDPTYAAFSIFIPFPGLPIHEVFKAKGYIKTFNWEKYNWYGYPVFETELLSASEMKALQREAEIKFYLRPKKIITYIWQALKTRNFKTIIRNIFAFLNIITNRGSIS